MHSCENEYSHGERTKVMNVGESGALRWGSRRGGRRVAEPVASVSCWEKTGRTVAKRYSRHGKKHGSK